MTPEQEARLPNLFEGEMGRIMTGIKCAASEKVQLVTFQTSTTAAANSVCTLGLSRFLLPFGVGSARLRFEWLMSFRSDLQPDWAASVMDHFLSMVLRNQMDPPKRGSWIPLGRSIWPGDASAGIYFSNPIFCGETFLSELRKMEIVLVGVIPITRTELEVLENYGWPALEEQWSKHATVELLDPFRN